MFQAQQNFLVVILVVVVVLLGTLSSVTAFCPPRFATMAQPSSSTRLNEGQVETLEFKIFPDGRVEETVRGVKGNTCHSITEGINEMLGKVVVSEPTEEMYEQEVVIDQTLTESVTDTSSSVETGTGAGEAGWEGQSSW